MIPRYRVTCTVNVVFAVAEENFIEAEFAVALNVDVNESAVVALDSVVVHREDENATFVSIVLEGHDLMSIGALGRQYIDQSHADRQLDVELTANEFGFVVEDNSIAVVAVYIAEVSQRAGNIGLNSGSSHLELVAIVHVNILLAESEVDVSSDVGDVDALVAVDIGGNSLPEGLFVVGEFGIAYTVTNPVNDLHHILRSNLTVAVHNVAGVYS